MLVLHILSWECYLNLSNCRKRKVRGGVGQVRLSRSWRRRGTWYETPASPGGVRVSCRPPRTVCHSRVSMVLDGGSARARAVGGGVALTSVTPLPAPPCVLVPHGMFDIIYLF